MLKIIIFALISLFLILFLNNYKKEYALILAAAAGGGILVAVLTEIYSPFKEMLSWLEDCGIDSDLIFYLLKAMGICYITRFASELCSDFGQGSLSGKVELAGKGAVFILSIPMFKSILNLGLSLLKT